MEDKILVNLSTDANHTFECSTNIIGREGEGYTSRFEITIPAKFTGCSVYLDFEKPNGEKLRTPKLNMENGVAVYDVHPYLLTDGGEIKAQAVLIAENGQTWKSSKKKYHIPKSINALEEIPDKEDFMTEARRVLEDIVNASVEDEVQDDKINAIDKRVTTLESAVYGDLAQEVEDNSVAYVKDVPSNALPYAEIKKIGGMTRKRTNLIPYPYSNTTTTANGITFTVNDDGTIIANGTATARASFVVLSRSAKKLLSNDTVFLSGCPSGGSVSTWYVSLSYYNGDTFVTGVNDIGSGNTLSFPDGDVEANAISIVIGAGITVSNLVFKPMLYEPNFEGLRSAPVIEVESVGANGTHTIQIPEAVQALDGYGEGVNESVYNYIDFEKKQFVRRVGKVDMGTLEWYCYQGVLNGFVLNKKAGVYNLLTSVYTNTNAYWDAMPDKTIMGDSTTGNITVTDATYAYVDAEHFKTAMSGIMLYYELAEPVITDISDILSADNYIEVEGGGSLTFKNEYGYDVPSEVVFVTKGASE